MKERLQNVFKETPESFTCTIESALSEARLSKRKKRLSAPLRAVIAVLLILAILPSAVFGAVKLYGAIAQRVGNYGVSFNISINEEVPQYVKMNIDVPKGFEEVPNTARAKYHRDSGELGFSILPMRFYESVDYTVLERDVKDYNEIRIASRPAYELIGTDDYQGLVRYYVWFDEANILMLVYRGETVTDSEFEAFVNGISFTKGTENDHDEFFEPENAEEKPDEFIEYTYEYIFEELPKDTEITFAGYNEETGESNLEVKTVITNISVTDNINGLDENDINPSFEHDKVADRNGKLLPRTIETWQNGDGVITESKMLSAESKEQKLVLIDIECTNTTDKAVELYIPHRIETLTKDEKGNYTFVADVDKAQNITENGYNDTEIFYMSLHGEYDKNFYIPTLEPNETRTITIGFRCIDEQIGNAYIVLNPVTDGVIISDYSDSPNTYFIFKVQ